MDSNFSTLDIVLIIVLVAFFISGVVFFIDRHKSKNKSNRDKAVKNALFYQRAYIQFMRIPFFRRKLVRIKLRLASINPYDELTLRRETMRITLHTLTFLLLGVIVFAIISQSFMGTLFAIIGAILLNSLLVTVYVKKVEDKLLVQLVDFLEEERHQYQDTKEVDVAIYEAAQLSQHEIKLQMEKIHSMLTGKNPPKELDAFYDVAPNRYLKIFAGVSHLVMEYGDKVIQKGSMYLNSLSKLVRDIRDDVMRRDRLSYRLSKLKIIALSPILLTFPLVLWAETFFPIMKDFYEGRAGYILRLIIYAASIIFFLLLNKVSELEDARYIAPIGRKEWEKKLYEFAIVRFIIDRIVPRRYTTKRKNIERLLKESNSPLTIEWFYIQRVTVSLACFILVTFISFFLHWNAIHHVKHNITLEQSSFVGALTPETKEQAKERTWMDNQIIGDLKGVDNLTRSIVNEKVMEFTSSETNTIHLKATTDRILTKISILNNEYYKWYELLIALGFGVLGFYFPYWLVQFQRRIRLQEMQNEVDHFHTLISILCEFEFSSPEMILEWLERYSIIFKPALQKCLNNFEQGAVNALEELMKDAPFTSFVKIINRLIRASEKISVKEAFDDLEMHQEYHREQKIERLNRLINKKVFLGKLFGWSPILLLIGLFLVIPMLYVSLTSMDTLMNQLQHLI